MHKMDEVQFYTSNRGHPKLAYKGFDYSKDRLYKENTYWKCVDRNCQGRLTTKNCQVIRETKPFLTINKISTKKLDKKDLFIYLFFYLFIYLFIYSENAFCLGIYLKIVLSYIIFGV